ncbi:MAG: TRAP transporter substrate-binding protein DctP [Alphaproteobacteria bacterium]
MKTMSRRGIPSLALCMLIAAPAATAETLKFTIISPAPPSVTPTTATKEYFVPEINRRLAASGNDLKVEWNEAYGPNLAKFSEILENVEEGIAHFGVLLRNFEESKLPLEQYPSMVPFGIIDPFAMAKVDARVRARVPQMNEMFLKFNQIMIASASSPPPHIFTRFEINSVDDLKGRKIGSSGAMGHVLRGTGAVLVTAAMSSSYSDIKNKVYEGYTMGETQAFPYRTFEVAQHLTRVYFGVTNVPSLVVNKRTWDSMPATLRTIISEVASRWGDEYLKMDSARTSEFTAKMVAQGLKVHEMPTAERQRWAKMMPNIAKDWAADMDKQGLPGTSILTAYMDEVRASGQPVVREWDKE